jgi:hypothetical protein
MIQNLLLKDEIEYKLHTHRVQCTGDAIPLFKSLHMTLRKHSPLLEKCLDVDFIEEFSLVAGNSLFGKRIFGNWICPFLWSLHKLSQMLCLLNLFLLSVGT